MQKVFNIMTPNLRNMFRRLQAFKWYHFCENAKVCEKSVRWIVLRFDAGLLANRELIIYDIIRRCSQKYGTSVIAINEMANSLQC